MNFFEEFQKLVLASPRQATQNRASENANFGDYIYRSKNIYLGYFLLDCEDCFYSEYLTKSRDCLDCAYLSSCELCCECVDGSSLYNCSFTQDCHNGSNLEFCFDCMNCKDCFGSFGLRQQQFCIFNKVYTEEMYAEKVAELRKNKPQKTLEILKPEFLKHPRLYARMLKGGERCFGDYIYFSKNCFQCFNVRNMDTAAYVSEILDAESANQDCYDCTYCSSIKSCFECFDCVNCSGCNFALSSANCSDSEYLINCYSCQNCFGCAYLTNKQYCILNKQFTREEYQVALKKIKETNRSDKRHRLTLDTILQ